MFCVSSSALSVGDISHAPVSASLPRDRVMFCFSPCVVSCSDTVFTVRCVAPLRSPLFHYITPSFSFLSRFRTFAVLRAFAVGRVIFIIFLRVSVPGPFNQWYIAILALACFARSSTSDAAPSSFVPRFQCSGDSSLFFAFFLLPVCSDCLFSDSLCTRLIAFCLAS